MGGIVEVRANDGWSAERFARVTYLLQIPQQVLRLDFSRGAGERAVVSDAQVKREHFTQKERQPQSNVPWHRDTLTEHYRVNVRELPSFLHQPHVGQPLQRDQ